jgi:hypothetical protein
LSGIGSARVAEDAEVKVLKVTSLKIVKNCDGIVMELKGGDDWAVGYGWESPL